MGRVFRIWRRDWKKNEQDQWFFVPNHKDFVFTMYMDSPETFPVIDSTVRECYMLSSDTPVLITYGMPNWMLFPSGPSSPIRIATTEDLVSLISQRPPLTDITLLCTFGAKSVAEFEFLSRSDFTIGASTYVVGEGQDDRARARYEKLVLGQRLVVSESVMREVFGEAEMAILHRVAMEMAYADRILGREAGEGVVRRMEIVQLDDDAMMADVSQNGVVVSGNGTQTVGSVIPYQTQPSPHVPATVAPSVLWDVGVDLFDYPGVYNTQSGGRQISEDAAFWKAVIEANQDPDDEIFYIASQNEIRVGLGLEETRMGVIGETSGDSSSSSKAIVCSQLGPEITNRVGGGHVIEVVDLDGYDESNTADTVKVSVGTASAAGGCPVPAGAKAGNTSSEGSENEGETYAFQNDIQIGMLFSNREAFKHHVAMFAIANNFCFRSAKSDPGMMVLQCVSASCPWRVYAIKLKDSEVFEVRRVVSDHTCSITERGGYQSQATSAVIGELMKSKFVGNVMGPKPREIRLMMRGDHDVSISYWKAWKSRDKAVDSGHGTCTDSYINLPAYLNNLVLANPGSLANLHTEPTAQGGNRFKYMFLALGGCVEGYKAMRKVVFIDGIHLKGKYAGCLLTASAQDGNDQIFPLAFAIVDSENDNSWEWFFQNLSQFVLNDREIFVSDRHPSIFKGISKVYPKAGHCVCVVHLKRNIRSNFHGRNLEHLVAKAARAYRLHDFYTTFNEIKEMNPSCAAYLIDLGLQRWARAHFPGNRYNVMTSNLAESWNFVLREAREFPIVPLIDFIRSKLTTWFATRCEATKKFGGVVTPCIEGIMTANFEMTGGYEVIEIAEKEYEIRNKSAVSFHVNLQTMTCSCYEFQMLAIPCSHAVAATLKAKINFNDLVIEPFKVTNLRHAYEGTVLPETGSNGVIDLPDYLAALNLAPPATHRPPGRPKKLRYFSRGEHRMKYVRRKIVCSRCKGIGHNKATCKNPI